MPQPLRPGEIVDVDHASREEVDSGAYFERAREWARMLYDLPIVERSYALLALAIVSLTFVIALMILWSSDPLSRPVRIAFENPNSGIDFPRITALAQPDRAPLQKAVARYIAQQYVVAREGYRYDRDAIDSQYRLVYNLSNPDVFQNYKTILDPSNAQSPLVRFERHTSLIAAYPVTQIEVSDPVNGVVRGHARVSYSERINGPKGFLQKRRYATLEFLMAEISVHKEDNRVYQYNVETKQPELLVGALNFRVTKYDIP